MTKRGDGQSADSKMPERYYIVSGVEIDRIFTPLTVMHAYVQLLRRRMGSGATCETQDLEQALAHMEKATQTMTADLRAILSATTHP